MFFDRERSQNLPGCRQRKLRCAEAYSEIWSVCRRVWDGERVKESKNEREKEEPEGSFRRETSERWTAAKCTDRDGDVKWGRKTNGRPDNAAVLRGGRRSLARKLLHGAGLSPCMKKHTQVGQHRNVGDIGSLGGVALGRKSLSGYYDRVRDGKKWCERRKKKLDCTARQQTCFLKRTHETFLVCGGLTNPESDNEVPILGGSSYFWYEGKWNNLLLNCSNKRLFMFAPYKTVVPQLRPWTMLVGFVQRHTSSLGYW